MDGLIQWPSSGAQVGFNAEDNINYVNVPGSRTPNILNIAQMSNVGIEGQWVFQVNQSHIQQGKKVLHYVSCKAHHKLMCAFAADLVSSSSYTLLYTRYKNILSKKVSRI